MKRDNVNYLLVGSFVLLMGIVLLYALYRITGHSAKGETYLTHFSNVAGIKPGSVVTFEGFEVGNVDAIEPVRKDERNLYRVTLNIRKPLRLPRDSHAQIAAPGLLAAPLVEIKEGRSTEFIASGGEIPGQAGSNVMESVASLANKLEQLTDTRLDPLLAQANTISASLAENLPATLDDMRGTMARLNTTAGQVETLFSPENQKHWSGMLKNGFETSDRLLKLSGELHKVSDETRGLVADSRSLINDSGRDLQLSLRRADAMLYQLESTGRNLNEFSRTIRNNPAAVIQNRPPVDVSGEAQ